MLPDAEALFAAFLRGAALVTALVGTRSTTAIPENPTWPLTTTTRVGGVQTQSWEDRPRLSVSCWGGTKEQAADLAAAVVAVLPDVIGQHATYGGWVRGAVPVAGPLWAPDDDDNRPRYVVDVVLVTMPNP